MFNHCEKFDKIMRYEIKDKHFDGNGRKFYSQFIITKDIIETPNVDQLTKHLENILIFIIKNTIFSYYMCA